MPLFRLFVISDGVKSFIRIQLPRFDRLWNVSCSLLTLILAIGLRNRIWIQFSKESDLDPDYITYRSGLPAPHLKSLYNLPNFMFNMYWLKLIIEVILYSKLGLFSNIFYTKYWDRSDPNPVFCGRSDPEPVILNPEPPNLVQYLLNKVIIKW